MSYVENDESSETLNDALTRAGDHQEIGLLNEQALNLTKRDICNFLNNNTDPSVSEEATNSLFKFAKRRIIDGKRVFPWDKMEEVQPLEEDDNIGGGTW